MAKQKPIIAWNNLFERGTVVASSEATGFDAENAFDGLSWDSWKANASGASTLAVYCSSAQECDAWGFYGSNLHDNGGTIKLQYSDDGATWADIGTTITPTHGGAHLQKFSAASHPFWRVYVSSPDAASYFAHVFIGKALEFQRGILAGVFVPQLARTAEILDNTSEGGAFLGRSVIRRGAQIALSVNNMTEAWVRSYWEPFLDYAEKRPFLICWEPGDHSDECAFARTRGKSQPVAYNDSTYMDHVLELECLIEPPTEQTSLSVAAPSAPANLAAITGAENGEIDLTWDAVTPVVASITYKVYRSTTPGGARTLVTSGLSVTSHTDTGRADNTTYYYAVTAVDALAQESAESTEDSATTLPAVPANVAADTDTGTAGAIDVTWDAVTGATTYSLYESDTENGSYAQIQTGIATNSYNRTGLGDNVQRWYKVTAVNANGESDLSTADDATTLVGAPTNLTATKINASRIDLAWTAVSGATSYNVYRGTLNGGPYAQIATGVGTNSYSNTTGLLPATTYYYVVTAVSAAGESGYSNQASATT